MPNGIYDPKLSLAGFMDLVCAIQERLKTPDSKQILGAMSLAQRDAAQRLGEAAKAYVDGVEGRANLSPTGPTTGELMSGAGLSSLVRAFLAREDECRERENDEERRFTDMERTQYRILRVSAVQALRTALATAGSGPVVMPLPGAITNALKLVLCESEAMCEEYEAGCLRCDAVASLRQYFGLPVEQ